VHRVLAVVAQGELQHLNATHIFMIPLAAPTRRLRVEVVILALWGIVGG
jgi:hypothetical protein